MKDIKGIEFLKASLNKFTIIEQKMIDLLKKDNRNERDKAYQEIGNMFKEMTGFHERFNKIFQKIDETKIVPQEFGEDNKAMLSEFFDRIFNENQIINFEKLESLEEGREKEKLSKIMRQQINKIIKESDNKLKLLGKQLHNKFNSLRKLQQKINDIYNMEK